MTLQTVSKWRKTLGVGRTTPGTRALLRANAPRTVGSPQAQANRRAKDRDPDRRAKIAAKQGQPRPAHVRAVLMVNLAKGLTPEVGEKVGGAHRRRGTRPALGGRP